MVNDINQATKVLSIAVDVTDEKGVNEAFKTAVDKFGVPHVLVNNAGALIKLDTIVNTDVESWWKTQVSCLIRRGISDQKCDTDVGAKGNQR